MVSIFLFVPVISHKKIFTGQQAGTDINRAPVRVVRTTRKSVAVVIIQQKRTFVRTPTLVAVHTLTPSMLD